MTSPLQPVGRAVVEALEAEGVSTVFGVPGGHILPIYDAVYTTPTGTGSSTRSSPLSPTWPGWPARPGAMAKG